MAPLTGSCLCGSTHITIHDPAPVLSAGLEICHCTDCRQFTGALASAVLYAHPDNVSVEGDEVKSYTTTSEKGTALTRHWCGRCGSSLFDSKGPESMVVHGGELRDRDRPGRGE